MINTPNVTLKADGDVKLTWYYGIGYTYYSAKNGYYDEEAAYNKTSKGTVSKWGASTYIKKNATGFKADGITFENSFNLYVTDEEIKDGVTLNTSAYSDSKVTFERTKGADVTSVAATERATALAIEAADVEFNNVTVLGSQDTLYTGPGTRGYFTNSKISGNTDFIFGYGDWLFENSELQFAGYSDGAKKHSYITAARGEGAQYGYLFENSTITGPDEGKTIGYSYLGRPWDNQAKVAFKNTTVSDDVTIDDLGWYKMSGRNPYDVNVKYKEYNTMVKGKAVDQDTRTDNNNGNRYSLVYDSEEEFDLDASDYIELMEWTPAALRDEPVEEPTVDDPTEEPTVEDPTTEDPATEDPATEDPATEDPSNAGSEATTGASTEAGNNATTGDTTETGNGSSSQASGNGTTTNSQSSNSGTASESQSSTDTNQSADTTTSVSNEGATNESAVLGASRDQESATVNSEEVVTDNETTVSGTRLASTGDDFSIAAHIAIIILACCMVIFILEMQEREEKKA